MLVFICFVANDCGQDFQCNKLMDKTWLIAALLIAILAALLFLYPIATPTRAAAPALPHQAASIPAKAAALPPSVANKVVELRSEAEADAFLSSGPGILMVYAPWCGHCKNMMPAFEQASNETDVKFARLEGSAAGGFMTRHQIRGFPTIMTSSSSNQLGRYTQGRDVASLVAGANALKIAA